MREKTNEEFRNEYGLPTDACDEKKLQDFVVVEIPFGHDDVSFVATLDSDSQAKKFAKWMNKHQNKYQYSAPSGFMVMTKEEYVKEKPWVQGRYE